MEAQELKGKIPNEIIESLAGRKITNFTPPQAAAILGGLLSNENIVVAAPTASGKTLIAEIACANAILRNQKKAIYIAPMRALVMEKFTEFKDAYPYLKATFTIGDLDRSDPDLKKYDMIFVSTEKFDSLMRHGLDWIDQIGCIVFDEVHMLGDAGRGPTLEVLMTKLGEVCKAQIIALSATIGNADEIADWLGAKLIQSDYRPVKLKKGIARDETLYYPSEESSFDITKEEMKGNSKIPEIRILEDTLKRSKQMLTFYSTKRNAEAGAVKLSPHTEEALTPADKKKLGELSDQILNALDRPTEQCIKLASLVKRGVAFHHAGLVNAQRWKIEQAFKDNLIKAICSTTTLGLGVNLPAHTVLVKDIYRFDGDGSNAMGVNEMLQLFGRAGRPKYDKEGRALLIAINKERVHKLYRDYIVAKPENVDSNLGSTPVLRTHILAFVAENFLNDKRGIQNFLKKTFFGFTYGDEHRIADITEQILKELIEFEFIEQQKEAFIATRVGKRVSELYIDPLSARWMLDMMENGLDTIGVLFMISNTLEMRPYVKATQDAEEMYVSFPYRSVNKRSRAYENMESMYYGYYDPVRAMSTALFLQDWMEEEKEPDIITKYRSTPGELFTKRETADWMIYSAIELARLTRIPVRELVNIRVRLRYGIKEELLDLVRLEQIGRMRARLLYMNGIKRASDIQANKEQVIKLLGKEVANKIIAQVE